MNNVQTLLNEKQVASILGVSLSKLRQDRMKGVGVQYHKIGKSVRYSLEEVERYIELNKINFKERAGVRHGK